MRREAPPKTVRFADVVASIGETPLVGLPRLAPEGTNLYAKLEGQNPTGSVKDRIARAMIEAAEREGLLDGDRVLLEPSSGNTGISMAMICRVKGYPLEVVMPESASVERRQLLQVYGAELHLSPGDQGTNGAIRVAEQMAKDNPKYLLLNQYENLANPQAHEEGTAVEIIRDMPEIDMFVAGLGTGGTLTGNGHALKRYNPGITVVAAEPPAGDLVQGLRSLDEGYIPPILDPSVIDRKYIVNSRDAFAATRALFEKEGVFAGISSGAALHVAIRAIKAVGAKNCVVLLADGGWKYLSTSVHTADADQVEKDMEGHMWW
jgi:cysteine synthase B